MLNGDLCIQCLILQTVLLPEVSPLVAINGTKLAKRIIVPINPKVMAHHENTQLFFRDAWHPRSRNPFAAIFRTIKVILRNLPLFFFIFC